MIQSNHPFSAIYEVPASKLKGSKVHLSVLREDLIHPQVSGNKYRKLKYNLKEAKALEYHQLLTFGGAFSNHIAATAAAGRTLGFETIGIIRGEELAGNSSLNPTLKFAQDCGMYLHFISRDEYRTKDSDEFLEKIQKKFGRFYLIPEGGTNALAIKGCEEILGEHTKDYDVICLSVGTGGTLAGIINAALPHQHVIGFSALNGNFQKNTIEPFIHKKTSYEIIDDYCFGGYAKIDLDLIRFINNFYINTNIPLDPIYTGKMMYGILDLERKGLWNENNRILAVHTGGLQGISGMNLKLKQKNLPQISFGHAY